MKYKATVEIKGRIEIEVDTTDIVKAAKIASEAIYANNKFDELDGFSVETIRVERTLS